MDFPQENFDAVIVGTGLVEAIAAAALARIGKSVLHLDKNTYYGGSWATYTLRDMDRWIEEHQTGSISDEAQAVDLSSIELSASESLFHLGDRVKDGIQNVVNFAATEECPEGSSLPESKAEESTISEDQTADEDGCNESLSKPRGGDVSSADNAEAESQTESQPNVSGEDASIVAAASGIEPSVEQGLSASGVDGDSTEVDNRAAEVASASRQAPATVENERLTWNHLKTKSRYFNFDLCPRLLFTRGDMVELLIKSKVSRYLEFRGITKTLAWLNEEVVQVPCSHADVFNSKLLSLVEKNVIKRFLTFCLNYDSHTEAFTGFEDRPFGEFLEVWPLGRKPQLSVNLRHLILHCIAMTSPDTSTVEALKATQFFLKSIGRYSNSTPFLWPVYGCGELPQAFCRMAAVFGGVYMLQRDVSALVLTDNSKRCAGLVCSEGGRVNCQWLVMSTSSCPQTWKKDGSSCRTIARAILVTDCSLVPADEPQHFLLTVPPSEEFSLPHLVQVIELPSLSQACPAGCCVVHLTTLSTGAPAEQLFSPLLSRLFGNLHSSGSSATAGCHGPTVLWSLFYDQTVDEVEPVVANSHLENVLVAPGPDHGLGLGAAVKAARDIFERICPTEEFLPPAPEPEDIVYETSNPGPEEGKEGTSNGQSANEVEVIAEGNTQENTKRDDKEASSEGRGTSQEVVD